MRSKVLLLLGLVYFLVFTTLTQAAQQKTNIEDDVEGSANMDNPDDEDFPEETSGLPPDDEHHREDPKNIQKEESHPTPAVYPPISGTIKPPGDYQSSVLDSHKIAILLGTFILVILIIVICVVCIRKKSRKPEYTRGTRQNNAYV